MKWLLTILALWPQLLHGQDQFSGEIKSSAISCTILVAEDIGATLPGSDLPVTPLEINASLETSSNIPGGTDSLAILQPYGHQFKARNLVIPATLITMGFVTMGIRPVIPMNLEIREEIQEHYPGFRTKLDNYTRHAPMAAAYGLNLAGIEGKHGYFNLTGIFLLSHFMNSALTKKIKSTTHQPRPDYSTFDAFPSGHTSEAFSQATILFLEYKDQSIWYGIGGYGFATATGALRLFNNKHWVSDVIAGAGVGILTARTAYTIYPWLIKKVSQEFPRLESKPRMLIIPSYAHGGAGVGLIYMLR